MPVLRICGPQPIFRLLLGVALLATAPFVSLSVTAAEDDRLYNVGVDVASRSLEDRRKGAAKGLETMLTRLSGLTTLPQSSALRSARAKPERYYAQYRYYSTNRYDELGQPLTQLNLQFSPRALRALMLSAQLPLWSLNRPRMALWLVESTASGTEIVDDPEHPVLAAALGRADYRGLPSVVPSISGGLGGLSVRNLVNRETSALRRAADRAGAELMLVGQAQQVGPEEWQVRWTSWGSGSSSQNLNLTGSTERATTQAIDKVVNTLVNRFTVAGGEAGTLELVVENISAVKDYAELLKYLSSRSYIENVNVGGLRGDELSLRVTTTGSAEKLMQLLAVDSRLVRSTRTRSLPTSSAPAPEPGPGSEPGTASTEFEYGARTAISVPKIADARLRVAWQG